MVFRQADGETTFSEIWNLHEHVALGAVLVAAISLAVLIVWETRLVKRHAFSKWVPGPLIVVVLGAAMNAMFAAVAPSLALDRSHLVTLPVSGGPVAFFGELPRPDFSSLALPAVYLTALTIAIVASLETLLSVEATDKLDPKKRISPTNRELWAQGVGNVVAGLLGGLPMTAVIVRSSANIGAGAQTRGSAVLHGVWLLLAAMFGATLVNQIPLAALAAILLMVGYKLTSPKLFGIMWHRGLDQFVPFVVTVGAILFTDLLVGILIGLVVGLFFVVKTNYHAAITVTRDDHRYLIRLKQSVSFLNKPLLRRAFAQIPEGSYVLIDGTRCEFLDDDVVDAIDRMRPSPRARTVVSPKCRGNRTRST
ncbi:MAG: SulP family inorganic anion transporter, partial [Myxococcales bacterium]|nr:SulP family inorganic anion transporter [Myxococcales bacterium]